MLKGIHELARPRHLPADIFLGQGLAHSGLAHLIGRRRYETNDDSRNSFLLAVATTGEGWHNNHHRYPSSARQGFRWWEIDVTYYVLWVLARLGIIWDLRQPPEGA